MPNNALVLTTPHWQCGGWENPMKNPVISPQISWSLWEENAQSGAVTIRGRTLLLVPLWHSFPTWACPAQEEWQSLCSRWAGSPCWALLLRGCWSVKVSLFPGSFLHVASGGGGRKDACRNDCRPRLWLLLDQQTAPRPVSVWLKPAAR